MSLGKKILLVLLPLFALALTVLGLFVYLRRLPQPLVRQIISPAWTHPVLIEPGDTFEITVKCAEEPEIERVVLNNTAAPEELEYKLKVEKSVFSKEKQSAVITVRAPKIVPEVLYDISIWYRDGSILLHDRQVNSVAVRMPREHAFSFAVVSQFAFRADVDNPAQRRKKIRAMFDELNLMNPDFIVLTGGISDGLWNGAEDVRTLFQLVENSLQVPMFIIPNEDDIGRVSLLGRTLRSENTLWRRVSNTRRFRFAHQGFAFIGADTYSCADRTRRVISRGDTAPGCISEKELRWLEKQFEKATGDKQQIVLFTHHSPARAKWTNDQGLNVDVFQQESQKKLLKIIQKYDVKVVFSGHVQRDTVQRAGNADTLFVTTGRSRTLIGADEPAMRLVAVENGVLNADNISYVNKPASMPLGRVTATFRKPNDGGASANSITVNNGIKRPLSNMAITVIMARKDDNSNYEVKGEASVVQAYGTTSQFLFLAFDLEPGEKRIFEIK